MFFAGEHEDEHKARCERGARVTRDGIVTLAPRSPRALCSPSRSPTKRKINNACSAESREKQSL